MLHELRPLIRHHFLIPRFTYPVHARAPFQGLLRPPLCISCISFSFRSGFDLLRLAVPPLPRPTRILAAGLHNLILHVCSVGLESQTWAFLLGMRRLFPIFTNFLLFSILQLILNTAKTRSSGSSEYSAVCFRLLRYCSCATWLGLCHKKQFRNQWIVTALTVGDSSTNP